MENDQKKLYRISFTYEMVFPYEYYLSQKYVLLQANWIWIICSWTHRAHFVVSFNLRKAEGKVSLWSVGNWKPNNQPRQIILAFRFNNINIQATPTSILTQ